MEADKHVRDKNHIIPFPDPRDRPLDLYFCAAHRIVLVQTYDGDAPDCPLCAIGSTIQG